MTRRGLRSSKMSVEELKAQRTLSYEKVGRISDRLKASIEQKPDRAVAVQLAQLKKLFNKFERDHLAYLMKAKIDVNNQPARELYDEIDTIVGDAAQEVAEYQLRREDEITALKEQQERDALITYNQERRNELALDFSRESAFLMRFMDELLVRMRDRPENRLGVATLAAEIVYSQQKHDAANRKLEEAVQLSATGQRR